TGNLHETLQRLYIPEYILFSTRCNHQAGISLDQETMCHFARPSLMHGARKDKMFVISKDGGQVRFGRELYFRPAELIR
ncbi:hypothetical protein, partial [Acidiphilium sp.]|uniref:hypothetical protein n=1 Tax=Acidiphilium sp. TaxID=527 RepID=UPI003CFFBA8F